MELLAPAGNREALHAAIENGADAVYLGGKSFSARQSAANFSDEEIVRALEYAHLKQRKIYVTLNTLIDQEEFRVALDYAWSLYNIGIDALIVQDLGLMKALRQLLPGLRLHASTQMTVHNLEGIKFLEQQGIKRVVLAREMSLQEIQEIKGAAKDLEIEVFVHGALCLSYSGQCLFSSMVGGRSGNRGRCAQPCRMPYELHSLDSGKAFHTPDAGPYILSPSDLCLIDYLPELQSIGVNSLKIEGRMKRPEYVAVVTRAYREVLDLTREKDSFRPGPAVRERLLKIFNRSFSSGYFVFDRNKFLSSKRPNNRGVYAGRVTAQDQNLITSVKLSDRIALGDGLEFWVKHGKNPSCTVKNMMVGGVPVTFAQAGEMVELKLDQRVYPHDRVFKTHDEEIIAEAQSTMGRAESNKIRVDVKAVLKAGKPLKLIMRDEKGQEVIEYGQSPAQPAKNQPLDEGLLKDKIDRLGNTPFYLGSFELQADADLIVPFSEINETRRLAVESLKTISLNLNRPSGEEADSFRQGRGRLLALGPGVKNHAKPQLSIALSGLDQAYAAAKNGADIIYLDLAGIGPQPRITTQGLKQIKEYAQSYGCQLIPALPRIQKTSEFQDFKELKTAGFEEILAGNLGSMYWAWNHELKVRADYSMNIFNPYTLGFLQELGVEKACISPELNYNRLKAMPDLSGAELIVHGEVILMTSQYCVLQGLLSSGLGGCTGLCHQDRYAIKDQRGYIFPIATDRYCRFYVFNSRTLCMIDDLDKIMSLGAGGIRIEARRSREEEVVQVITLYRQALEDLVSNSNKQLHAYREELERSASSPFTRGHYYRGVI
ncbi:MAG: U32 family peptidase [Syntrophomonadaceae bacterium]|nr:U32 family peptidase [Syntrophomonadaceae bacterium]